MAVCAINLALSVIAGTTAAWAGWLALAGILVNTAGIILFTTLFISTSYRPAPVRPQPRPQATYTDPAHQSPYGRQCTPRSIPPQPAQDASAVPPPASQTLLWAYRHEKR